MTCMADKRQGSTDTGASPGEFLKVIKRRPVVVKLNSGVDYRGVRSQRICMLVWREI